MCSAESQAAENFCRRTDGQKDGPTVGPLVGRHTLFKNLKKTPLRRAMHGFRSHRFLFPFLPCFSPPCVLERAARRATVCHRSKAASVAVLGLAGDKRESSNARSLRSSQSSLIGDVEIASTFLANTIPRGRIKFVTENMFLSNSDVSSK